MSEALVRDELVDLLNKLGGETDEEVLAAARQAHARIAAAGMTWEDLLVPDEAAADPGDADDDAGDDAAGDDDAGDEDAGDDAAGDEDADEDAEFTDVEAEDAAEPPAEAARKNAGSRALIDKLLARKGISEELRRELEDYKIDIAEGDFEERDRKYLRALHGRLSKRK